MSKTRDKQIMRALDMATETRDHQPTHSTFLMQEEDGTWLGKIAEFGTGEVGKS